MKRYREITPGPSWAPNYRGPLLTWDEFLYRNAGGGFWVTCDMGTPDKDEN